MSANMLPRSASEIMSAQPIFAPRSGSAQPMVAPRSGPGAVGVQGAAW